MLHPAWVFASSSLVPEPPAGIDLAVAELADPVCIVGSGHGRADR
jgi:hypothetical protein